MICGLVAAVLFTFLWAAYLRVEATLVRAAGDRAQAAGDQVANLLDGRRSAEQLRQVANDPTLKRLLNDRTDGAREALRARLKPFTQNAARRIEIWDATGSRLLEIPGVSAGGVTTSPLPPGTFPLVPGTGKLQKFGDTVFSDTVAEIRDGSKPAIFLLLRSTFVENPPGVFRRLVGRDAEVTVANRTGDIWSDFSGSTTPLPVDLTSPGVTKYRAQNGEMRLGAVVLIPNTPWAAWTDFPLATVVAPARLFLKQMIVVALVFLAGAAIVVSLVSARITRPLSELSLAADTIATGDYSRRVGGERGDEIGRLGRAFNAMAGQIKEAHDRLEARVVQRTAQLEAANQELEAFSYSVSHDLRAPLRSIDGFSQALLEDSADKLDEKGKGHLQRVRAAAHRMGHLIDDLLELSRVGRAELNRNRVSLSEVGRSVAAELQKANSNRKVEMKIQDGLFVEADRHLLQIVLENLLGNAWKFTANATPATIQLGKEDTAGTDGVVYFVRDNGAGFDMTYVDKLFRPFQRLHGHGEFPGTGIGLATVHRIVDRHGGRVWAEGAVDAGATVFFTLPPLESGAQV